MIAMFVGTSAIDSRTHSRKFVEVSNEMRLIVVATIDRDLRPLGIRVEVGRRKGALKTLEPRKQFGRQAYLLFEQLNETARTQACG